MLIWSSIITGLGLGSMYGLLALGFYITYSVSQTVNFAQGSSMMLGAVVYYGVGVTLGWPAAIATIVALAVCAVWGWVVERFVVRPFAGQGSTAWLMATVAAGIVLENVVLFTYGKEPRSLPSSLAQDPIVIGDLGVYPLQILIPIVGLAIACALHIVSRRTKLGTAQLAVVQNPDAARLLGIDVRKAIVGAYVVSTVFAGIAGILIAPLFNVASDMGTLFGIKAFAVAIIGGIKSPWGVMVAGLAYGVVEALITATLGSVYTQILTFALVIVVLAAMPNGLFGKAEVKKV
ncbi:MAG: branched-chain amino acid ABC transporter permease [Gammaproteobacteria bacterium]|nr:MAG: branched-chain amino acid ABC transporter permease [Gammaproteobacteria bacterium]